MNFFKINNNKFINQKIFFYISAIIIIFLFLFPIINFGIKDLEEYQLGIFTINYYFQNFNNFFDTFTDAYGPGVNLPIGHMPKYHPANLFIENAIIFHLIFFSLNLFTQIFFLKKIFKLLFNSESLLIVLIVFTIPNFNYVFSDNWPMAHFIFSLAFPILYYFIKFLIFEHKYSYFKLIFWISYEISNGHIGSSGLTFVLLGLFLIFNFKSFYLNKAYFYFGLFFLVCIVSSKFEFLINSFISFEDNVESGPRPGYSLFTYIKSSILPLATNEVLNETNPFPTNRNPYFGIIFPIVTFFSVYNFKKSKDIYYLNIIFLILIVLSLGNVANYFFFISAGYQFRDMSNILSIILIYHYFFYEKINFKILKNKNIILYVHFFICIIFLSYCTVKYIDFTKTNFIAKKKTKINLLKEINKIEILKDGKIYFSPKIYPKLRNGFKEYGIYSITDLIIFNQMSPFNGWFKNNSMSDFQKDERIMHGKIEPRYELINNEIFLNSFLVKNLIYFESEKYQITIPHKVVGIFNSKHGKIFFARLTNIGIPSLKDNNFLEIKNACIDKKIECFLNKNFFEINKKISFDKVMKNKYKIINNDKSDKWILFPFSNSENWHPNLKLKKIDTFKKITLTKVNKNEKKIFSYNNIFRKYLRIFSEIFLIIFLIFIIFYKNKKSPI